MGQKQKIEKTEGATAPGRTTRQQIKKVESNGSPEIPDCWGDIKSTWH